jgi:pheromone shutdown protein TraB
LEALKNEPDMYPHTALWRLRNFFKIQSAWTHNYEDWMNTLHTRGGEAFAESCDRSRINFLVGLFNKIAPKQKKILVDWRGEGIFRDIYNIKENNIVAVVNQWHM